MFLAYGVAGGTRGTKLLVLFIAWEMRPNGPLSTNNLIEEAPRS
jgi:hypothetical protein